MYTNKNVVMYINNDINRFLLLLTNQLEAKHNFVDIMMA